MSKRKRQEPEQGNSLKNRLNQDIISKLSEKKSTLKQQEEKAKEEDRRKIIEERKRREANKSFEELLAESEMDWKKFK